MRSCTCNTHTTKWLKLSNNATYAWVRRMLVAVCLTAPSLWIEKFFTAHLYDCNAMLLFPCSPFWNYRTERSHLPSTFETSPYPLSHLSLVSRHNKINCWCEPAHATPIQPNGWCYGITLHMDEWEGCLLSHDTIRSIVHGNNHCSRWTDTCA